MSRSFFDDTSVLLAAAMDFSDDDFDDDFSDADGEDAFLDDEDDYDDFDDEMLYDEDFNTDLPESLDDFDEEDVRFSDDPDDF